MSPQRKPSRRTQAINLLKERASRAAEAQFTDGPNPDRQIRRVAGAFELFQDLYIDQRDDHDHEVRTAIEAVGTTRAPFIWAGAFLAEVLGTDLRARKGRAA